jgi:hypothetical protein
MKSGWKKARGGDRAGAGGVGGVGGGLAVWELAACAGLAGGLAGLVGNPAEVSDGMDVSLRPRPRRGTHSLPSPRSRFLGTTSK